LAYHLLKEVGRGRAGGHGDTDGLREPLGVLGGAEEGVDRRRSIEMGDSLVLQKLPYQGIVDLAEAVVRPTHGAYRPRECPSDGVEPELM